MTRRDQSDVLMPRRLFEHLRGLCSGDAQPQLRPETCGDCQALVAWALAEPYRTASVVRLGEKFRELEARS